jgi:hypothetical protein
VHRRGGIPDAITVSTLHLLLRVHGLYERFIVKSHTKGWTPLCAMASVKSHDGDVPAVVFASEIVQHRVKRGLHLFDAGLQPALRRFTGM